LRGRPAGRGADDDVAERRSLVDPAGVVISTVA
jgi:hypothetical protein